MPNAQGNPTIGDVIAADVNATADQSAKAAAAEAADKALADANASLAAADKALATGLAAVGPAATVDPAGTITVYLPDSTPKGFHTIIPVGINTPLPTPAPAPSPAPVPAS